jgi:hypothetical protein
MKWVLATILALLLVSVLLRESFTDTEYTNITEPCWCSTGSPVCEPKCKVWTSKVEALAPTGASVGDYIAVLKTFFNSVYKPSPMKPTEARVDTFLASSAGTVAGVDVPSVKRIIIDAFHIEQTGTAASREEKSQMFKPSDANLAPSMGRDEVRTREEGGYTGANPVLSTKYPEGDYAPVSQTKPLNPGQWEDGSTKWKGPRPASVCPCAENVM